MRKFFRTTYSVAVIALFIAAAVVGFTQTKVFKSYLRTQLIEAVAKDLDGELLLSALEGNLFTGFRAENIVLRHKGAPVLTAEQLEAGYDPFGLLTKRVSISRLLLSNPSIYLTRADNGEWNIDSFFRSSSSDTAPSSWTVDLKQILIKAGNLRIVDSLGLAGGVRDSSRQQIPDRFDYSDVQIDSLDLDAAFSLSSGEIALNVRSLTCRTQHPYVQIKGLSGDFALAERYLFARKVRVETGKSSLQADARLDNIDITKISRLAELQQVPISARLNIERLDFGELKQFVGTPVGFLERDAAFQIDLQGRFGLIDVRNVTVRAGESVVRIAGTVANLHTPDDLELDLACIRNKVDPADLRSLMPSLGIPDLTALGVVDYDLRFKGKPTTFNAKLSSSSQIGNVDVEGNIDVRGGTFAYDGTIRTQALNVAPVVGDSTLSSNLKAKIFIQGRGTRFAEMTSLVRIDVDSSVFAGLAVRRSVAIVDVADRTMRPRISVHIGSTSIDIGGTLQVQARNATLCDLSGRINSLNLSNLTRKRHHESDISFDFKVKGAVQSVSAIAGDIALNVFRSSIDTVRFDGGTASIKINTMDGDPKTLRIASDIADVDVRGAFTPISLVSAVVHAAGALEEVIRYRINSLDSLRAERTIQQTVRDFRSQHLSERDSTAFTFNLDLKDCFPLGVLLGKDVGGRLAAKGRMQDGPEGIQFDVHGDVPQFNYLDDKISFSLAGCSVGVNAAGLASPSALQSLILSAQVKAKHFEIQDFPTANLDAGLTLRGDSAWCSLGGLLDSTVVVRADGAGFFGNRRLSLDLQRLEADFNGYAFSNDGMIPIELGRDGLHTSRLVVRHDREEIRASGFFDPGGSSECSVSAQSLLLENVPRMFRQITSREPMPEMKGTLSGVWTFEGSFEEPRFSAELIAHNVEHQGRAFGEIVGRGSYAERTLDLFAQLSSRSDSAGAPPVLLVNGTIPYNLSISGGREHKLQGEMNLDVRSSSFPLELLDPFLAELSNLTGSLVCDVKLRGTVESPSYEGSLSLNQARFLFNPLGIQYIIDGALVPRGRKIGFENMVVRNIPADRPDGKITLAGNFSLEGLTIRNFDLIANGQLLIMKESARLSSEGLYGDLFVASGAEGLFWKGTPSSSTVNGEVFVKYANLTLPPIRQSQDLPHSGIKVNIVDDVKKAGSTEGAGVTKATTLTPRGVKPLSPAKETASGSSTSFLDNIAYNLSVETQGVTQLRFVFSNFTNEQLLAELKGRTAFTRAGDQMHLTGELDLGNRSYYNNFKKLDATGKVKFTGDPVNPELNVVASYEGVHRDTSAVSASGGGTRGGYQKVIVKVFITGTRDQPKVRMGLEQYDQLGNLRPERADVQADALAFLVTGAFPEEFTQQDRLALAGSNVLGGVASSILSGPLTDLLRKEFGIVRSVDVLYYGGGTLQESADVRLTGELGDAVFRLGGRVLSDLNNTNVSIQVPMSAIVGSEKWRNLVLEAERRVQGVETIDQRRESRGLRLLYRIIF